MCEIMHVDSNSQIRVSGPNSLGGLSKVLMLSIIAAMVLLLSSCITKFGVQLQHWV